MHAHCSDVGTSFTTDPEDTEVLFRVEFDEFTLVDSSNSELSLDSGDPGVSD